MPEWKIRFYKWICKIERGRKQKRIKRDLLKEFEICYITNLKNGLNLSEDDKCIGDCCPYTECPYREEDQK